MRIAPREIAPCECGECPECAAYRRGVADATNNEHNALALIDSLHEEIETQRRQAETWRSEAATAYDALLDELRATRDERDRLARRHAVAVRLLKEHNDTATAPKPTPVERDRYAEALGLLMRAAWLITDVIDAADATTRATAEHAARRWLDAVTDWSREEE